MAHVHRIAKLGAVNAYLVEEEDGLTLVDTLVTGTAKQILAASRALGRPILRIVITHGHSDHVGSLDALAPQIPGVEVIWSRREGRLIDQDFSVEPGERGTPKAFLFPKLRTKASRLVEPGDRIGSLEVVAAPGHTPGQIALLDPRDRTLYASDAVQSFGGLSVTSRPTLPFPFPALFATDRVAAAETGRALAALAPARVCPGHGSVVEPAAEALQRAAAKA